MQIILNLSDHDAVSRIWMNKMIELNGLRLKDDKRKSLYRESVDILFVEMLI